MSGDDTDAMGYNPHRKFVPKRGDVALVVMSIAIVLALVIWALIG
jgi:hypothetical protein